MQRTHRLIGSIASTLAIVAPAFGAEVQGLSGDPLPARIESLRTRPDPGVPVVERDQGADYLPAWWSAAAATEVVHRSVQLGGGAFYSDRCNSNGYAICFDQRCNPSRAHIPAMEGGTGKAYLVAGWFELYDRNVRGPHYYRIDFQPFCNIAFRRLSTCLPASGSQSFWESVTDPAGDVQIVAAERFWWDSYHGKTERWYFTGYLVTPENPRLPGCDETRYEHTCSCVLTHSQQLSQVGVAWAGRVASKNTAGGGALYANWAIRWVEDQPADVNLDGQVTGLDIAAIRAPGVWNRTIREAGDTRADVNGDGQVNGLDIAEVRRVMTADR